MLLSQRRAIHGVCVAGQDARVPSFGSSHSRAPPILAREAALELAAEPPLRVRREPDVAAVEQPLRLRVGRLGPERRAVAGHVELHEPALLVPAELERARRGQVHRLERVGAGDHDAPPHPVDEGAALDPPLAGARHHGGPLLERRHLPVGSPGVAARICGEEVDLDGSRARGQRQIRSERGNSEREQHGPPGGVTRRQFATPAFARPAPPE
ncbi:MAG: hypothetical protein R3F59_33280 [Myxococcota bacterium]